MIELILESRARTFVRNLTPKSLHAELLRNQVGFCELTFDDDSDDLDKIEAGSRVVLLRDGVPKLAGPIVQQSGSKSGGDVVVRAEDDFRVFRNLGWPNPSAAIDAQTSEYRRYTGPTETVVKQAIAELNTMLSLGLTVVPSIGLGADQRVEIRFHPLVDKLVPLLDAGNLCLTVSDGGIVDVHEGTLFPRTLTPDSGVLGDYKWTTTAPLNTRVVVGGEGEGTERLFQQFIDADRENEWGFIAAVFKDSRMAQGVTDLSPDGAEALAEGAPTVAITTDLLENSWFRWGLYELGDRLRVELGAIQSTEAITQIVIDDTADNGLTVVPHLGQIDDEDAHTASDISRLNARIRDQGRR